MEGQPEQAAQVVDLAAALGFDGDISMQCFTIYVPNKDRNGQEIGNQRKWVLEAIMSKRIQPSEGTLKTIRDNKKGGSLR